jgi:hypothetical protein
MRASKHPPLVVAQEGHARRNCSHVRGCRASESLQRGFGVKSWRSGPYSRPLRTRSLRRSTRTRAPWRPLPERRTHGTRSLPGGSRCPKYCPSRGARSTNRRSEIVTGIDGRELGTPACNRRTGAMPGKNVGARTFVHADFTKLRKARSKRALRRPLKNVAKAGRRS